MKQEINLYQAELFPREDALSARRCLFIVLAAICVLAVVSGYGHWREGQLEKKLHRIQQQVKATEIKVSQLQTQYASSREDPRLVREIKQLQGVTTIKRSLLVRIKAAGLGGTTGFSPYLEALARQTSGDVWLRDISLRPDEVALEGRTRHPAEIPEYLKHISREKVFQGLEFNRFTLNRLDNGEVEFLLTTATEEKHE